MDGFFGHFPAFVLDTDRLIIAVGVLFLSFIGGLVTGPWLYSAKPLIYKIFDLCFAPIGDRLDRLVRPRSDLIFRGFLLSSVLILLVLILSAFIENKVVSTGYGSYIEMFLLAALLSSGGVLRAIWTLYRALEDGKTTPGAYLSIVQSTRTTLLNADDPGMTRVAMGFCVRSFDKGVVSPLFWYLIGGMPVVFLYSTLAFLSWRFGKDGFTKGFGVAPLSLEKIMGFVPGVLAGVLVGLAGLFTPGARFVRGFGFLAYPAPYAQGGYPLAALAWSLNLTLGGPGQDVTDSAIQAVWTGPDGASAQNSHGNLKRALYLVFIAHILLLACICAAYWLSLSNA